MKNYKKLFIIILSVLMVAFISCVETVETTSSPTNPENPLLIFRLSDLIGTWTNAVDTNTFIVQEETNTGSIIINSNELVRIITWDKSKELYSYVYGKTAMYVTNERKSTKNYYYFWFAGTNRIECKLEKNYGRETLYYKQ